MDLCAAGPSCSASTFSWRRQKVRSQSPDMGQKSSEHAHRLLCAEEAAAKTNRRLTEERQPRCRRTNARGKWRTEVGERAHESFAAHVACELLDREHVPGIMSDKQTNVNGQSSAKAE